MIVKRKKGRTMRGDQLPGAAFQEGARRRRSSLEPLAMPSGPWRNRATARPSLGPLQEPGQPSEAGDLVLGHGRRGQARRAPSGGQVAMAGFLSDRGGPIRPRKIHRPNHCGQPLVPQNTLRSSPDMEAMILVFFLAKIAYCYVLLLLFMYSYIKYKIMII